MYRLMIDSAPVQATRNLTLDSIVYLVDRVSMGLNIPSLQAAPTSHVKVSISLLYADTTTLHRAILTITLHPILCLLVVRIHGLPYPLGLVLAAGEAGISNIWCVKHIL
jgi:hypothetical protein